MKNKLKQKNIPEGWKKVRLSDCLLHKPDYGINAAAVKFTNLLPAYLRITDISEDGKFLPEKKTSIDHINFKDYILENGDIVFARTGASVGKTYQYNEKDGKLIFAGFLIRIKPDQKKIIPDFLNAYTHTDKYYKWVDETSPRSGQPGINSNEYSSLSFSLPPVDEQERIARILEVWNRGIDKLGEKIEIKKRIKKGLMQELLTGKTRLPGFSKKWENVKLGDVLDKIEGGGTPSKKEAEYWNGRIPWASVKDIVTHNPNDTIDHISEIGLKNSSSRIVSKGTLIAPTRMALGHAVFFNIDVAINQDLKALYPKKELNNKYLFYWYKSKQKFIERLGSGSTVSGIQQNELKVIDFLLPPMNEQKEMVAILETCSKEIIELNKKLAKMKEQKRFLLNNLITGAIRVPES